MYRAPPAPFARWSSCSLALLLAACTQQAPPAPPRAAGPTLAVPQAAVHADPAAAIEASMARFRGARSFVAEMTLEGARTQRSRLEYVAPDRYRLQLPIGTQVIVGDTLYLQGPNGSQRVPLPPGLLTQWRDPLQLQPGERLQVEDLGPATVDGAAAHQYRVRHRDAARPPMLFWVGAGGWPLRIEQAGRDARGDYRVVLAYSRFDDPALRIDPP